MKPYHISSYGRKPVFSSFLPGVAGERGIPLWCFYVNRGQAVASFGSRDKNHSIMEFSPASTACQRTQTHGFRTFIKLDGHFIEPFRDGLGDMHIGENVLSLTWQSAEAQLKAEVSYFVVPNMPCGMLARRLKLTSLSQTSRRAEMLDGMAAIVPFGLAQHDLKMMGQTAKAWMMTEGFENCLPYFRLRSSLTDTTSVLPIEDGSFGAAAVCGQLLRPVVDPTVVFDWDTSFHSPERFLCHSLSELLSAPQRLENELPCCFFAWEGNLMPGETLTAESLFGLSHGVNSFHPHVFSLLLNGGLAQKHQEARELLSPWLQAVETHTADERFDRYCRQTYIDNFLRGGVPKIFRHGQSVQPFYLFSRKHGDLERDYNDFVVTPEYESQGNGNFRDVLQNRRSDVRFCRDVGWKPLRPFLELIQPDGYNPLVIQPATYVLPEKTPLPQGCEFIRAIVSHSFTPGSLRKALESSPLSADRQELALAEILCAAQPEVNASFGEGYWVDHWIYLLDMLENYLSVYPENRKSLLNDRCLRWYASRASVLPLHRRCVMTENGLRQYHSLSPQKHPSHGWLTYTDGHEVLSTPFEKLFMLCILKFAALDQSGEAVSMEAGKPGWYDALNGLPGLFGSSTAESCELWRMLHFLLESHVPSLQLPLEMAELARRISKISRNDSPAERWKQATEALEAYRAGLSEQAGRAATLKAEEVADILRSLERRVSGSVSALLEKSGGLLPTYFTNLPIQWSEKEDGIFPESFDHRALPPFLEGPVHALRLPVAQETKQRITEAVRASALFDQKLQMYKVSSDLSHETPELGRANAFTRGWLEHESIWLHMEYKYLLELLKNNFYDAFFRDFENALIPFQPEERYGRSVLENSSFLASSANPDPGTHGRGFVARLSGATAEFLEMWQILFFGIKPFTCDEGELVFSLSPTLPKCLIPQEGHVEAMLLGQTRVIYHLSEAENITPETHRVQSYTLREASGKEIHISSACISGDTARSVRDGHYTLITAELVRR